MTIDVATPPVPGGRVRIKQINVDLNGKKTEYPRKLAQISGGNTHESDMVKGELDVATPSEYYLELTPSTISNIVNDGRAHQKMKDQIQRNISKAQKATVSIYIRLKDEKDDNRQLLPFPRPSDPILAKIFDLVDLDGVDVINLPIRSDSAINWMNKGLEVFLTRKPDFLGEYKLSGYIPNMVTDATAQAMVEKYVKSGIDCLTFDFGGHSIPTSMIRGIADDTVGRERWGEMYIHGVNVPHYDSRTWTKPVSGEYDLLMGIYGFDSFTNMRYSPGGGPTEDEKIPFKIRNQRYSMVESYGMYNKEGLEALSQTHDISCPCPICRSMDPLDLYENALADPSPKALKAGLERLRGNMKTHRQYHAHLECLKLHDIIRKEAYVDYLDEKRQATNEINSMVHDQSKGK